MLHFSFVLLSVVSFAPLFFHMYIRITYMYMDISVIRLRMLYNLCQKKCTVIVYYIWLSLKLLEYTIYPSRRIKRGDTSSSHTHDNPAPLKRPSDKYVLYRQARYNNTSQWMETFPPYKGEKKI